MVNDANIWIEKGLAIGHTPRELLLGGLGTWVEEFAYPRRPTFGLGAPLKIF